VAHLPTLVDSSIYLLPIHAQEIIYTARFPHKPFYFRIKALFHNKELHGVYSSANITGVTKSKKLHGRSMWQVWAERRGACMILVGKPEGKRPLRKPRRRKDLKETCWVWTGFIWLKIRTSGGLL
jgi:hypothetical protein